MPKYANGPNYKSYFIIIISIILLTIIVGGLRLRHTHKIRTDKVSGNHSKKEKNLFFWFPFSAVRDSQEVAIIDPSQFELAINVEARHQQQQQPLPFSSWGSLLTVRVSIVVLTFLSLSHLGCRVIIQVWSFLFCFCVASSWFFSLFFVIIWGSSCHLLLAHDRFSSRDWWQLTKPTSL